MAPKRIALLTDSCADLSPQQAEENHIYVVPLTIICADGDFTDGVDIDAADVVARLERGENPKTSLPNGGNMEAVLEKIARAGYDGVIAVMLSSGLSGTYNMMCIHAKERPDLEIAVFDSGSASVGTSGILLQLAEDIRAGASWRELTHKRVPRLIAGTEVFFSVDTLEYLQRGGRIGKVTAFAGTMLQIKPILSFAEGGVLGSVAKARGRKQVPAKLIEMAVKSCGKHKKYNLAVVNGGAEEEMQQMKEDLKKALPNYDHIWQGSLDGTLSVYIGGGVLGVLVQTLD